MPVSFGLGITNRGSAALFTICRSNSSDVSEAASGNPIMAPPCVIAFDKSCPMGYRLGFSPLVSNPAGRDIETHPQALPLVSAASWEIHDAHCSLDRSESAEAESNSNPLRPAMYLWFGQAPGLASLRTCCWITTADRYRMCRGRSG